MKLNFLLHLKETIKDCLEKPNVALAFVLVLLPTIFAVILDSIIGLKIDAFERSITLFSGIVSWLIIGFIIYILVYIGKRKEIHGKFPGILSCLGVIRLIGAIITIVLFIVPFFISTDVMETYARLQNGEITSEEAITAINTFTAQDPNAISLAPIFILVLIATILLIYALYLYYRTIASLSGYGAAKNLIIWIITIIIALILPI
jgi:hypothetical protein